MPILIEHPTHGRMHVYSDHELKAHQELGWYEVKPEPPKPEINSLRASPKTRRRK